MKRYRLLITDKHGDYRVLKHYETSEEIFPVIDDLYIMGYRQFSIDMYSEVFGTWENIWRY